jgi:hypothetical protein
VHSNLDIVVGTLPVQDTDLDIRILQLTVADVEWIEYLTLTLRQLVLVVTQASAASKTSILDLGQHLAA